MPSVRIEPCQYNGQSDSRFLCCLHGLRIVCEALSKRSKNSFMASPATRSRSRYALKHISSPP